MVSFDVVSLFTKVPLDDALQSILTLLFNDEKLEEQTISANAICQLTKLCLRTTYFQFEDQFFMQNPCMSPYGTQLSQTPQLAGL